MAKLVCASCQQTIHGRYIKAMGKNWHSDCFRCPVCGELIGTGSFLQKGGRPYHTDCYHKKFAPRCAGCGQVITGPSIRAMRKHWHPEHFICARCGKPIEGKFFTHQGRAYCSADYQLLFAEKCSRCGEPLTGRYFEDLWGNKYCSSHRREPRCSSCSRFIGSPEAPKGVKYADGRVMCTTCLKTAVNEPERVNRLVEEIKTVLARQGFQFDARAKIPITLTGQKDLHNALQKRSRGVTTAGVTQTNVHAILGVERSREVKMIQALYGLPYEHLGAVLAHELGHAWLFLNHFPHLPQYVEEGICEWISSLWLQAYGSDMAQFRLLVMEKNPSRVYGRGYRAMKKAVARRSAAEVLKYVKQHAELP